MRAKDHEHPSTFHTRVQEVHGPVAETFLRAHLNLMHGATAPITDQGWDGLVGTHRQLHPETPVSTPQMPFPHHHTGPADDIVTFHAERTVTAVRHHLIREHGIDAAGIPVNQVLQRHAEAHAVPLGAEQAAALTERDRRTYTAGVLRRLVQLHLGSEVKHADLTLPDGDVVEIATIEEVVDWLLGVAIRVENGADL